MVQHMKTVPCDLLARECLCVNLGRNGRYTCFDERALSASQVETCSQCHVEILSYRQRVSTQMCYMQKWTPRTEEGKRSYGHRGISSCVHGQVCSLGNVWLLAQEWLYQREYIVWSVLSFVCQLGARLGLQSQ